MIPAEFGHSPAVEADATTDQTNQLAKCSPAPAKFPLGKSFSKRRRSAVFSLLEETSKADRASISFFLISPK